ncbi:MAG: VWA domain-containing protein [Proteobacteria bacterium]|nr:VWA domain-containing protein [Pseudomonadota bacterium]
MSMRRPPGNKLGPHHSSISVDRFLSDAAHSKLPAARSTHRLIFALDATGSRQPTWDLACELHAELFSEAARLGNIAIQLCYYRGLSEFVASAWTTTPTSLRAHMSAVSCRAGRTQIGPLLEHAAREAAQYPVRALVFIGDCFEEDAKEVMRLAGQLAIRSLPVIIFQEGGERAATRLFRSIADITHGAHVPFNGNSPEELRRLLGAVAQYTIGGHEALESYSQRIGNSQTQALLNQLGPS